MDLLNKYFDRAFTWNLFSYETSTIVLHDDSAPRVITLDPWPELIFLAADGQRTIGDYIEELRTMYDDSPPDGLENYVLGLVADMEADRYIRIVDEPVTLPRYLDRPLCEQTPEEYMRQMMEDGFIKPHEGIRH
jgi:hypothetical protein